MVLGLHLQASMKTKMIATQCAILSISAMLFAGGCSTITGKESDKEIAAMGPTIMNVRTEPSTIELNGNLQPVTSAEVLADVKDFHSRVSGVSLRFTSVPLQIPMENIGGTTWRATLTPDQLQMLAVSGKTISYDATVVAKNVKGQTAMSQKPVEVAIKTPEIAKSATG